MGIADRIIGCAIAVKKVVRVGSFAQQNDSPSMSVIGSRNDRPERMWSALRVVLHAIQRLTPRRTMNHSFARWIQPEPSESTKKMNKIPRYLSLASLVSPPNFLVFKPSALLASSLSLSLSVYLSVCFLAYGAGIGHHSG